MPEFYGVQKETAGPTPTMIRVIRICRKCGARILADAPEGLCPRCVLKTALAMPSKLVAGGDSSAEASPKADGPDQFDKQNVLRRASASQRCSANSAITNCWKRSVAVVRA